MSAVVAGRHLGTVLAPGFSKRVGVAELGIQYSEYPITKRIILQEFHSNYYKRLDIGMGRIFLSCPDVTQPLNLIWSTIDFDAYGPWGTWKDVTEFDTGIPLIYILLA